MSPQRASREVAAAEGWSAGPMVSAVLAIRESLGVQNGWRRAGTGVGMANEATTWTTSAGSVGATLGEHGVQVVVVCARGDFLFQRSGDAKLSVPGRAERGQYRTAGQWSEDLYVMVVALRRVRESCASCASAGTEGGL